MVTSQRQLLSSLHFFRRDLQTTADAVLHLFLCPNSFANRLLTTAGSGKGMGKGMGAKEWSTMKLT